jgi:GTP-binding protein
MNGENAKGRVVAVVGRPNVGKSALFNRIARKRAAIVHDQSGVTRDRLMLEVEREGKTFNLVDTGGVTMASREDDFAGDIRAQVEAALQDAAVVIMTVDVQSGLTPLDEEVAAMVRKADVPCVLAINKCDLPRHESRAEEFARLGMKSFTVSAEHGTGITELVDAVMPYLPETINETIANPLRVAVVGRPNAGKSSYINRLLHSDRLIVSDVAGTTRDSIDVPFTVGSGKSARQNARISV